MEDRAGPFLDPVHSSSGEVLGPAVVPGKRVQRIGQPPEPPLEWPPFLAGEAAVDAPRPAREQRRDVRPLAALRFGHGTESSGERRFGRLVTARRVLRVALEGEAPPRGRFAAPGGRQGLGVTTGLHQVPQPLAGDPVVARERSGRFAEMSDEFVARSRDLGRLRRWIPGHVVVPDA